MKMKLVSLFFKGIILSALLLGGCVSVPVEQRVAEDPWQGYNRAMFKFNAGLDKAVLKPAAKGYRWVLPDFVERGISNFFSNLGDVPNSLNNLLQGKFKAAGGDSIRFLMNSTFGIAGFFDVASSTGLEKHNEDFGQTLGVWGVPSGPYLMLPLLGPSSVRDSGGFLVDLAMRPQSYIDDDEVRWGLYAIELVSARNSVLKLEESAGLGIYDDYEQMREVYLQRRKSLIANGHPDDDAADDDVLRKELEALEGLEE